MPQLKRSEPEAEPAPHAPPRRLAPPPGSFEPLAAGEAQRYWLALVPAAVLLGLVLRSAWVAEDAYITLRTVDNWVHGNGLRWNANERVQAYTHPLWMFALSAIYACLNQGFMSAVLLGMACSAAALALVVALARSPGHAVAALVLLAACRSFIDYATSGLENPLSHLLAGAFIYGYAIRQAPLWQLAAVCALLALNRSDALVLVAPALAHVAWLSLTPRGAKRTALDLALGLSPLLAWELFSLWYYGFFVPNTAFAKLNTGVPRGELLLQGAIYLKDALAWDPPILLVIGLGLGLAIATRELRLGLIALGCALYLVYVLRIGGDFMIGRFLTLPLFAAVCLIARCRLSLDQPGWLGVLLAPFALLWLHPNGTERWPVGAMSHDGIADERAYYHGSTSLMMQTRTREMPHHFWIEGASRARLLGKRVELSGNVGLQGFYAGPSVHIVDFHALTDPLLARLPARHDPFWRIGHYAREVPAGYLRTIETGVCEMTDAKLCEYYAKLREIVSGDLVSRSRLLTIARMNLGAYDHLIDFDRYRYPGRRELSAEELMPVVLEDSAWNSPGMRVLTPSGVLVRLARVEHVPSVELSLDGNDDYAVEFRRGKELLGAVSSRSQRTSHVHTRSLRTPELARSEGFDTLFIRPTNGDGSYSVGYLRLCL